jgi:type I restriction enzyme S subunit
MELMKGYKQTEVGVIPYDWNLEELGKCLLSHPKYGIGAPACNYNDTLPTYLRITDISEDGKFIHENKSSVNNTNSHEYILENGEIVFARTGASVGKSYLYNKSDGILIYAGFLIKVKPDPSKLNSYFLKSIVTTKHYWNWIGMVSMRSGQPGINSNQLSSFILPIPSLKEQTAIAQALSDAEAYITSLEKLIEKKRQIQRGAKQELLKPKDGWITYNLEEICLIRKGQQLNKSTLTQEGDFPVMNGGISPSGFTSQFNQCENTIIISEGGNSCGFVNYIKTKFWQGGHCYSIETDLNTDFLYHLLKFKEREIMSLRVGSGLPNIQLKRLYSFQLTIPNNETQIELAEIFNSLDLEIKILTKNLDKIKKIKQGMIQNLLTGKIRLI